MIEHKRVVYKVSGESLAHSTHLASSPIAIDRFRFVAREIQSLTDVGTEVLVMVGGGNLFRGADQGDWPLRRERADAVGMLATGMNAILLGSVLEEIGLSAVVLARGPAEGIGEAWCTSRATDALVRGSVVVVAGGMGIPFMSSDYPAVHHAVEVEASTVLVAKNGVDGVYDADPKRHPSATKMERVRCSDILDQRLDVMDFSSIELALRFGVSLHIFSAVSEGSAIQALKGQHVGTLVVPE